MLQLKYSDALLRVLDNTGLQISIDSDAGVIFVLTDDPRNTIETLRQLVDIDVLSDS
jgi:hypothetical protein